MGGANRARRRTQYNTLGYESGGPGRAGEREQEGNLLYVALTRAARSLTFVFPQTTADVASPLLPRDLVYGAREADDDDD